MNIQEYIASGILEQFVLGQLTADQAAEVERNADEYREIADEIARIQVGFEQYATAHAVEPDADFKERVMSGLGDSTPPAAATGSKPPWSWIWGILLLAALVGMFMALSSITKMQDRQDTVEAQLLQLQQDCDSQQVQLNLAETHLQHVLDAGTRTINLAGTDLSPQSSVNVFWNPDAQETYIDVVNLPDPPSGNQYQLWALVDGTPVDMGVITLDPALDTLAQVLHIADAGGFAITLEPAGGSENPTLEQMYVIGTI